MINDLDPGFHKIFANQEAEGLGNVIRIKIETSNKKFIQHVQKHFGLSKTKSKKFSGNNDLKDFEVADLDQFNLKTIKVSMNLNCVGLTSFMVFSTFFLF